MSKKEKRTLGCIAVVIALLFIFCARFAVMAKMRTLPASGLPLERMALAAS